ncbi:hypothetical protein ACFRDV_22045 [Streptomyces fagopyri]|uniref:hypothetical protein n=1 Tax=Streptomyces fagopyri TaxID=2662397 RepID=UPI0036870022
MAISFVAAATGVTSQITDTTLACSVPSGTANGDVMIALISRPSSSATVTTQAGWTIISGFPISNTNGTVLTGFYRVASGEPASYTWAFSTGKCCIATMSYRGVDTVTPVHKSAAAADTTTRTGHTSPSITTTIANCWTIGGFCDRGTSSSSTWTTPSGLTSRASLGTTGTSDNSLAVFDSNGALAAGAYSYASTASQSLSTAAMCTLALAPAPPTPPAQPVILRQAMARSALR